MLKTGERYKELSAIFAAVREVCLVLLNFIVVWLMVVLLLTTTVNGLENKDPSKYVLRVSSA